MKSRIYERILAWTTEGAYEIFGNMYRQILARRLLLGCFEGLGSDSHRRFVRGSREISPASCHASAPPRHSVHARDERGVSIWAELRMRAGELLKNAQKPNT